MGKRQTKQLGFRVDETLAGKFEDLCTQNKTTPSDELRRYMSACVGDGKLPQTDDELIPADALDKRIQSLNQATESRLTALEAAIASMNQQLLELVGEGSAVAIADDDNTVTTVTTDSNIPANSHEEIPEVEETEETPQTVPPLEIPEEGISVAELSRRLMFGREAGKKVKPPAIAKAIEKALLHHGLAAFPHWSKVRDPEGIAWEQVNVHRKAPRTPYKFKPAPEPLTPLPDGQLRTLTGMKEI